MKLVLSDAFAFGTNTVIYGGGDYLNELDNPDGSGFVSRSTTDLTNNYNMDIFSGRVGRGFGPRGEMRIERHGPAILPAPP